MESIFVLIQSNFQDESEHKPIAVSGNREWLIKKIPDDFEQMEGFIPTYAGKHGEYFEIRQCENIIDEPYDGIKLSTLTKKKFKELIDVHTYGRGRNTTKKLFIDWRNDYEANAVGYKYCVTGYGCTKEFLIKHAYDILVEVHEPDSGWRKCGQELVWFEVKRAKTEQDRFKVSITA